LEDVCLACQQQCVATAANECVDIRLSLGASRRGENGFLEVRSENPDTTLGTPQALKNNFVSPEVTTIFDANGWIRQVYALDRVLDVLTNSSTSYSVLFYDPSNVVDFTNGLYQFQNSPFRTATISLVNGDTNTVRLTDSADPYSSDFSWLGSGWALTKGGGLSTENRTTTYNGSISTVLRTIQNAQSNIQSSITETWQLFSFGNRKTQEVFGSGSNAKTNTFSYNTNGLLDTVIRSDGTWDVYQYDNLARQTNHFTAFTNSAPTTNASLCRRITSTYTNSVVSGSGDDWTQNKYAPRQVVESIQGVEVSRRYAVLQTGLRIDIQCVNPGAAWNDAANLYTTNNLATDYVRYGEPSKVIRPDGTMQLTSWVYWPIPTVFGKKFLKRTTWTGAPTLDFPNTYNSVTNGILTETWFDKYGRIPLEVNSDIPSGIMTSSNNYSYDGLGRLTNTLFMDGTISSQIYDCCGLTSATERDGTVITYTYDGLHRLLTTTRASVTTSNVYDSAGNVLSVVRYGNDTSSMTLSQSAYDTAGQQVNSTDGLNNTTQYTNYLDASSQSIRQTTYPDSTTRIETYARDAALVKVTGTAVHGLRYEYGVQSDGGFQRRYTKEIKLDNSGNDTTEWTKTLTDGMGRAYKVIYSDNASSQSIFSALGQLAKQADPDGVVSLFQYNTSGALEYTALDVNTNGIIDFSGIDRITWNVSDFINNGTLGALVKRTRVFAWGTNNSNSSNLLSSTQASTDGFHVWQTVYRDATTAVTNRSDTFFAGGGLVYQTNTAPDGSSTLSQSLNGRLLSVVQRDSLGNQIASTTYSYDAHGRQLQITDGRNGSTTYGYNSADLVVSATTPAPGNGQSAQTTFTYYNNRLQVSSVLAADGVTTTYEYYPTAELKRTYGARTYPVGYSYDYAGRVKTMTNWTSFNSNLGARVTTWNYNTNRGWLDNKRYDNNAGPDYTYTPGGRLRSRVWARIGSGSARIATTNSYGFNDSITTNQFPELVTIAYANDPQATPGITNTYDRRGRLLTVARNGITKTFAYNPASQILSETNSGGTLSSWWITNAYDTLLRRTNVQAKAGATLNATITYGYDTASRLSTVTDGTNNATYAYVANSPLVSQITLKSNSTTRLTVNKSYDYLNRLTSISSTPSAASAITFGSSYNDANQRVRVGTADGSFWVYEYDSLGQVTSGKRYWPDWTPVAGQQFEYTHDDIGNRTSTKAGGDENGLNLRAATYGANNLNQYTNRTVPGGADVIGVSMASATVTVNNQATYRHGEYYRKELSITNTSAPQYQSVTNKATQSATTNTVTGNVFLPKTPEVFVYDADGNLLSDGRWTNSWDAENRLISMSGISTLPTAARQKLDFEYDWMGRRIRKTLSNWVSNKFSPVSTNRYVYDGWNLLIEANPSNVTQRKYIWGLDLSGSEQGAGGVGGMVAMQDVVGGNGVQFAAYDLNGNVAALVKATNGAISATYEYGPFGELVRASGILARTNFVRFSTKYQDDESDMLYYGYRFYNPSTGRWLSRDPAAEAGGIGLYTLLANSPIGATDFLGLAGKDPSVEVINLLFGLIRDARRSPVQKAMGLPDAFTKERSVLSEISLVTDPSGVKKGAEATYRRGTIYFKPHFAEITLMHELAHAYIDKRHITPDERLDEGMAYGLERIYEMYKFNGLEQIERVLAKDQPCDEIRRLASEYWKKAWQKNSSPAVIPQLYVDDVSYRFNSTDFANVSGNFGAKISCHAIAEALNALIPDKCGCLFFSCEEVNKYGGLEMEAGVAIDDAFK
jgi:RHS repeat-associated protein